MSDTVHPMPATHKGRRTLLLLAVVFLGPMALAMLLHFTGFQPRPGSTTQNGELFEPARPLPDVSTLLLSDRAGAGHLHGKWTLLYAGPAGCDETCQQALVKIRQVRLALGRDRERVQRLYLATDGPADRVLLGAEYPGLGIVEDAAAAQGLLAGIGGIRPGDLFLTDPLGNLVMRYPADTTLKAIHADLKHLLQVSTIG